LAEFLTPQLELVQPLVQSGLRQQFAMTPALPDLSVVQYQDLIGVKDRAEPVGDDDARPARHQLADRALNQRFGFRVHRAGGLIEHQDPGIEREGASEAQELALAHAQAPAPLAQAMGVGGRKSLDEPVRPHPLGRLARRLRRDRGVEGEVVQDVAGEEEEILLTNPMIERSSAVESSRMSTPSMVMRPRSGS